MRVHPNVKLGDGYSYKLTRTISRCPLLWKNEDFWTGINGISRKVSQWFASRSRNGRTLKWYGSFDRTIGASTVPGSQLYLTESFVIRMQLYWKNLVALIKHQWWIKMHFQTLPPHKTETRLKRWWYLWCHVNKFEARFLAIITVMTVMHTAQLCIPCTNVIYAGILFAQQYLKLELV